MSDDLNIKMNLDGNEEVQRGLKAVGEAGQKVGEDIKEGSRGAKSGLEGISQAGGETTSKMDQMALAFGKVQTAMGGFKALWAELTKRMQEANAEFAKTMELTSGFTNDISPVQHMLGKFDPSVRANVGKYAVEGERSLAETATAYYNLISSAGDMTPGQQHDLFMEALEIGKTEPDSSLDQIVSAMSLYSQKTGTSDQNTVQNLLKTALGKAKTDMGGLASYMPRFLPGATAAGLSGPDALGTWATASLALNSPDLATTSLEGFFGGLEGKGTPESKKLLESYGVVQDDSFFQKIQKLSVANAQGKIGYADMQAIAGGPGASVMKAFLDNPQLLMSNVQQMREVASDPHLDIVKKELHKKMMNDPFALTESMRKKAEAVEDWFRANDLDAAQLSASEAVTRAASAKKGESPAEVERLIEFNRYARRVGRSSFGGVMDVVDPLGLYQIDELMSPEEVSQHQPDQYALEGRPEYGAEEKNVTINRIHNDQSVNYYRSDPGSKPRVSPYD